MKEVDKIFVKELISSIYFMHDRPDLMIRGGTEKQHKYAYSIYISHVISVCRREGMWNEIFFGKKGSLAGKRIIKDNLTRMFLFDYFSEGSCRVWIDRRNTNLFDEFKKWKKKVIGLIEEGEDEKCDADTNEKCA